MLTGSLDLKIIAARLLIRYFQKVLVGVRLLVLAGGADDALAHQPVELLLERRVALVLATHALR